ncbi:MGMT family protein [Candidatus Woesearchaeota archaeon]|nr:MGMT family protein [Candidatus Woesearchaeota archaeon]
MKFAEKVYELCKQVPEGKVTTYGEIAKKLNSSARAVGQALKRNPYAPIVPCHRVVKSDGCVGGFCGQSSGPEVKRKMGMLRKEGITIIDGKIENFEKKTTSFSSSAC